ncbi:hypothetical protein TWF696_009175 [Orbilia brochopaga]|uniref:Uncharacterized protein n=1 Tax=Orbilia brochopaga TaxID=3140254 RepID=A0AAV9UGN8_9PEZI
MDTNSQSSYFISSPPPQPFSGGIVRGDDQQNLSPRVDRVDTLGEANCFSALAQKSGQLPRLPNTDLDRRLRPIRNPVVRPVDNRVVKYLSVANWFGSPQVQAMKLYSSEGCEACTLVMIIRWYPRLNVIQLASLIDPSYLDIIPQRIQGMQPIIDIAPIASEDPEGGADEIDFAAEVVNNPGLMKPGSVYIPLIPNNGNDNTVARYCDGMVQFNEGVKSTLESLSVLAEEGQQDDGSQFRWLKSYVTKLLSFLAPSGQPFTARKPKGVEMLKFSCTLLAQRAYVPFPGQADSFAAGLPVETTESIITGQQPVSESTDVLNEQVSVVNGTDSNDQLLGGIGDIISSETQPPRRSQRKTAPCIAKTGCMTLSGN